MAISLGKLCLVAAVCVLFVALSESANTKNHPASKLSAKKEMAHHARKDADHTKSKKKDDGDGEGEGDCDDDDDDDSESSEEYGECDCDCGDGDKKRRKSGMKRSSLKARAGASSG